MWDWWINDTMAGDYDEITGETTAMYTPVAADQGKYLKARVRYTDGMFGNEEEASAPMMVMGAQVTVTRTEVLTAIRSYLAGGAGAPSRTEVLALIRTYLAQ